MSGFWQWFLTRRWDVPGIYKFWDRWLIVHLAIGLILAWVVPVPLVEASKTVLLPLASVLVGPSFAWAGNAQALLQTAEIEKFASEHAAGIRNYVFTFLTAILAILVTVVAWRIAGLGVFDRWWPTSVHPKLYCAVATILYAAAEHNPSGMLAGRNRSAVASPNTKGCQRRGEASLAKLGKPGSTEEEKWSRV